MAPGLGQSTRGPMGSGAHRGRKPQAELGLAQGLCCRPRLSLGQQAALRSERPALGRVALHTFSALPAQPGLGPQWALGEAKSSWKGENREGAEGQGWPGRARDQLCTQDLSSGSRECPTPLEEEPLGMALHPRVLTGLAHSRTHMHTHFLISQTTWSTSPEAAEIQPPPTPCLDWKTGWLRKYSRLSARPLRTR